MHRLALISDIHSNVTALEAVIADIESRDVDALWCLGDVVGYGARPIECMQLVEQHADVILAGNHDLAVAGMMSDENFNPKARAGVQHCRAIMQRDPAMFSRLATRASEEPAVTPAGIWAAHGCPTPHDPVSDYVEIDVAPADLLETVPARVIVTGHTHLPLIAIDSAARAADDVVYPQTTDGVDQPPAVTIASGARAVVNVGSVGQPRDGDPRACWTLIEFDSDADAELTVRWNRCAYDIEVEQKLINQAGLPAELGDRLWVGD